MEQSSVINTVLDDMVSDLPKKEDCVYTPHYCEENIWMLAKKIQERNPEKLKFCYPVFISNENNHIPLWRQRVGKDEDGLVVWDYHVIMVYYNEEASWVYDFDTQLKFPTPFSEYSKETFKSDEIVNPSFHRFFRVIPAESYLKFFSSDRSHMKRNGLWIKPPPEYPPLRNSEESHNLEQYISMKSESSEVTKFGYVFTLNSFIEKFSIKHAWFDYTTPQEPTYLGVLR
uniref:Protein N-terminal glutamine amidohydrolase n=1 Tax=Cuerna arida TaxID=1464854 RepID=A0A1B6G201_9HEMI